MTPKEKAIELIDMFEGHVIVLKRDEAKQCAWLHTNDLIELAGNVDKIINSLIEVLPENDKKLFTKSNGAAFWLSVKNEIKNL